MNTENQNLWPHDLAPTATTSPLAIVRAQAEAISQRTGEILKGRVTGPEIYYDSEGDYECFYSVGLEAPAIGNCVVDLFTLRFFPWAIYPVSLIGLRGVNSRVEIKNEAQLLLELHAVFASNESRNMVGALWAHALALGAKPQSEFEVDF